MARYKGPRGAAGWALGLTGALTAACFAAATRGGRMARHPATLPRASEPPPSPEKATLAARRLNRSAGTLAASVLFDSAVEHYRGDFENRAMYTPIVTSALALAVSAHGTFDKSPAAHRMRDGVYLLTGVVGLIGTGFHVWNVAQKPGRFIWQNLFYGAPLGAPMAIGLSGLLGFFSERVRDTPIGQTPRLFGLPAGRVIGAVSGAGMVGTTAEAGLLHFRGSFHDPFMALPVTMPPAAAAALTNASLGAAHTDRRLTRWWLRATAIMGVSGTVFHAIGIGRDMDGWRNIQQNLLNGPPIPAPPAFTGLALAGLAALDLMEDDSDV
ncbi:hypothetical protein [Asaia sp. VD9]|uniref:hypothetical protein n=1 Tax=Asaia sp. VD9 TaxID=3081235 RepID=UPI003015A06D